MTTIVDTFNRADNASALGTTSDTNATWTTRFGTCGISSNQAYASALGGGGTALATVPGGANGSVEATIVDGGGGPGPVFRMSDTSNYWVFFGYAGLPSFSGLWKVTAGSGARQAAVSCSNGDVIHIDFTGTSITVKNNGAVAATLTDSFNSGATDVGLLWGATTDRLDLFTFAQTVLVARRPHVVAPNRAVFRASVI